VSGVRAGIGGTDRASPRFVKFNAPPRAFALCQQDQGKQGILELLNLEDQALCAPSRLREREAFFLVVTGVPKQFTLWVPGRTRLLNPNTCVVTNSKARCDVASSPTTVPVERRFTNLPESGVHYVRS
jgi:hypothetical protein